MSELSSGDDINITGTARRLVRTDKKLFVCIVKKNNIYIKTRVCYVFQMLSLHYFFDNLQKTYKQISL